MKTHRIYQEDVYKKECGAMVKKVITRGKTAQLVLDQTVFFPEGGGQPCDTGSICICSAGCEQKLPVSHVSEKDGVVFHTIQIDDTNKSLLPDEGSPVSCSIDWERRLENMQRHCGEHILSGVFASLYGGANRGFHMGESYVTVDIRLENDPTFTKVTWEMCMQAEKRINDIIWEDLPVTVRHFQDPAMAARMPLRKDLSDELKGEGGDISIVTIGREDAPADCVACCGTHPAHTAQVGLVKIYKVEKNKNMFRIYFDCGKKALLDYDEKHRLITDISDRYSAGLDDLEKKIAAEESKNSQIRAHLNTLSRSIAKLYAKEILDHISKEPEKICFRRYSDLTCDDIMKIGKLIGPQLKKPALLLSETEHTVMLFSDGSIHCGNLVRENAGIYGGKGGGSDIQARAIFPDNTNTEIFADLIDKHLR